MKWFMILLLMFALGLGIFVATKRDRSLESFAVTSPKQIQVLLQRASHWAVMAEQNQNPQEALKQSSYAMGYLNALQDLASTEELDRHIDFPDFRERIIGIHERIARRVSCTTSG
jgi:hypothetical protein